MKTLIIVTNWNDQFRTLRCLNSLIKVNSNDFDILITDNFSKKKNLTKLINGIKKIKNRKFIFKKLKIFNYKKFNKNTQKIILYII